MTPNVILAAQRTIGNRAVQRMIQRKLRVGAANDAYEQEADRVANQVMSRPLQTNAVDAQRKPQDEAQRMPARISSIQRSGTSAGFDAGPDVQQALTNSQGHGQSLPANVRKQIEPRFGRSFEDVHIHTEPQADHLNRSLSAQAFTSGSDIYFGKGQYNPSTQSGQHLLAHELTHVVQQTGGVQRKAEAIQRKGKKDKDTPTTDTATVDTKDKTEVDTTTEKKNESVFEKNGLEPEYENDDLKDTPATSYKFTVIAWRPGANYLPIQKLRAWSKMRNVMRAGARSIPGLKSLIRTPKSGKEIKESALKKVAAKQPGYNQSDDDKKRIIAQMEDQSNDIGHTWIRLSAYVGDELKQVSSYGFWPENGFNHPTDSVDGEVMDPDHQHDNDGNVKALDSKISASKFNAGVTRVASLKKSPPKYKLIGYNCTKFAKDIAGVTGGTFPGKGNIFPAEPSKGMLQRIFSPDELYGKMEKNKKSYDTLSDVPRKPSKFVFSIGGDSESESESRRGSGLDAPEVKAVYHCVMNLALTSTRGGGTITADSGTRVMVISVDEDNETVEVEKERSGNDYNTRGRCSYTDFWSACIES